MMAKENTEGTDNDQVLEPSGIVFTSLLFVIFVANNVCVGVVRVFRG